MTVTRYPWWTTPVAVLAAAMLKALGATWRVRRVGTAERDARLAAGERCIYAFWHARQVPLTFTHRDRGAVVLSSRHRDGEIMVRVLSRFGYVSARGSSTRGGSTGVREMLRLAGEGRSMGITPDGPRGPAERVKPGLVYLASRTGLPVLPVAAAASDEWRLRTWDVMRVPRPFARVVVAYGDLITVPPEVEEAEVDTWCERIAASLRSVTDEVDALAREGR